MRVRPEPTQVQHLSGAPLKGKLMALPANIRLGWKDQPGTNNLAYYKHYGRKMFHNIGTVVLKMDTGAEQWKDRQNIGEGMKIWLMKYLKQCFKCP